MGRWSLARVANDAAEGLDLCNGNRIDDAMATVKASGGWYP